MIEQLERELAKLEQLDTTIDDQVDFCFHFFTHLPEYYLTADLILKRQIIGLIYPEKFVFQNNAIQTNRVHAAIPLICRTGNGFSDPKKRLAPKNGGQSSVVTSSGLPSAILFALA